MARSVVLISGGIASATVAALAADDGEAIWLHADYGQRNAAAESAAVEALAVCYKPTELVRISMPYWSKLGEFALLSNRELLPDALAIREAPDIAYVPGLMPSLVAAGLALASSYRIERVLIGLMEDRSVGDIPTHRLYPDRSREAIAAWDWQYQFASPGARPVRLEAPLIASKQGDLALLAQRLEVPLDRTWSCYRAGPTPCRRCYGCAARSMGFIQLGAADPLLATQSPAL